MEKRNILVLGTLIAIAAIVCVSAAAFYFASVPSLPVEKTGTITDLTGRTVEIPLDINRVAVLTSPCVQEMYIIGEGNKLCAITTSAKKRPILQKIDPQLKNIPAPRRCCADINIEELLRTNPDICIGSVMDMAVVEKNTDLLTVRIGAPDASFATLKREINLFGEIFGKEEEANEYISYLDEMLDMIKSRTSGIPLGNRVKVFLGFDSDHLVTYGGDTYMQERIEAAGCINVAKNVSTLGGKEGGLGIVSMEQVLAWNPDVIVINQGKPEDLLNDSRWAEISAIKNKKVFYLPQGIFIWNRPSAEAAVLLPEWLASISYQETFEDMDMGKEIKDFYSEIFDYNLCDEDVYEILHPVGTE